MNSALIKVPFLLANVIAFYVSYRAPNPTPDQVEQEKYAGARKTRDQVSYTYKWILALYYADLLGSIFAEIYVILTVAFPFLRQYQLPFQSTLLPNFQNMNKIRISPLFVVACLLMYSGGILRVICFRQMGKQFTFELAIKKDHELVTHGLYSFVRHPSYTASGAVLFGSILAQLAPGSIWFEFGLWYVVYWRVLFLFAVYWKVLAFLNSIVRIRKEDSVLRQEFGSKWDEWAKKTPYKMIPYLY